jgi:hypothetical protein
MKVLNIKSFNKGNIKMCCREKLRRLSELFKEKNEDDLITNIENMIQLCGKYVFKVSNMEAVFITANLTMDTREYREYINYYMKLRKLERIGL